MHIEVNDDYKSPVRAEQPARAEKQTKKKAKLNELAKKAKERSWFLSQIRDTAGDYYQDMTNDNIQLPARYAKDKLDTYVKKAKLRYRTRKDLPSSLKRKVADKSRELQLDPKFIKYTKNLKTANNVIQAALLRKATHHANKNNKTQKKASKKDQFKARVKEAAATNGVVLLNEDIKIPVSASNATFQQIVNASKKRYYAREKKASPFEEQVRREANAQGINQKYVKFLRIHKTMAELIKAARDRQTKNTVKTSKSSLRDRILAHAATLQADEKAVRSAICVRKKE